MYARELERQLGPGSYRAVWLELKNLEELGILTSRQVGRTVQYRINPDSPLVPELTELFRKNWAAKDLIGEAVSKAGDVAAAFIYGSFATGKFGPRSDIDLIIIGRVDAHALDDGLADVESKIGREVNYRLFTVEQWKREVRAATPFVREVLEGSKLFVAGSPLELEKLAG